MFLSGTEGPRRTKRIWAFNEAISKAKDSLGYRLTYRTPEQLGKNQKSITFNWAAAAFGVLALAAATLVACYYFRATKLLSPLPPPIDAPARLNGIGGWLILLAIGQLIRPVSYLKGLYDLYPTMISLDSWETLIDPTSSSYNGWWAPTLLFELFCNIFSLVFCILLVALFFKKRKVWPRCFATFVILVIVAMSFDSVLVDRIPAAAESISKTIRDVGAAVLAAAIWVPYVFLSKRVKATFRY